MMTAKQSKRYKLSRWLLLCLLTTTSANFKIGTLTDNKLPFLFGHEDKEAAILAMDMTFQDTSFSLYIGGATKDHKLVDSLEEELNHPRPWVAKYVAATLSNGSLSELTWFKYFKTNANL